MEQFRILVPTSALKEIRALRKQARTALKEGQRFQSELLMLTVRDKLTEVGLDSLYYVSSRLARLSRHQEVLKKSVRIIPGEWVTRVSFERVIHWDISEKRVDERV